MNQRSFNDADCGASYSSPQIDQVRLRVRSSRSFDCNDVSSLEAWLCQSNYQRQAPRSGVEFARLRKRDRLIVLYHSGSVVCQGDDWAGAITELRCFVIERGQA